MSGDGRGALIARLKGVAIRLVVVWAIFLIFVGIAVATGWFALTPIGAALGVIAGLTLRFRMRRARALRRVE